jgi:SAM-dependent methyltransferase
MRIHEEEPGAIRDYIEKHRDVTLEDEEPTFKGYMARITKFKTVDASTKMLEIGIGTGWFPILCKSKGLSCKGLEISPHLLEYAKTLGAQFGVEADLELANIEDYDLGKEQYDVIIASSVFEHVERWEIGLKKVYDALKPGGVLFFESTNKFSFRSAEFHFPLYGWLPDFARYRLRMAVQGPDIMHLGIDFNQFRYGQLRRFFKDLGFSRIVDRVELADLSSKTGLKRSVLAAAQKSGLLKALMHTFIVEVTTFVCVK